jgi:hypothetical protein
MGADPFDALSQDLDGEHRAEAVPPESDSLVADFHPAFVQQVLDVSERKWKANVHHEREANDLRAAVEVLERVAFCHGWTLRNRLARLKPNCSDNAVGGRPPHHHYGQADDL